MFRGSLQGEKEREANASGLACFSTDATVTTKQRRTDPIISKDLYGGRTRALSLSSLSSPRPSLAHPPFTDIHTHLSTHTTHIHPHPRDTHSFFDPFSHPLFLDLLMLPTPSQTPDLLAPFSSGAQRRLPAPRSKARLRYIARSSHVALSCPPFPPTVSTSIRRSPNPTTFPLTFRWIRACATK
jgi:hypothetical protein